MQSKHKMISDEELRERLARFYTDNQSVPPITEATRPVLLNKLKSLEGPSCSSLTDTSGQKTATEDEDKLMNEVEVVLKNDTLWVTFELAVI